MIVVCSKQSWQFQNPCFEFVFAASCVALCFPVHTHCTSPDSFAVHMYVYVLPRFSAWHGHSSPFYFDGSEYCHSRDSCTVLFFPSQHLLLHVHLKYMFRWIALIFKILLIWHVCFWVDDQRFVTNPLSNLKNNAKANVCCFRVDARQVDWTFNQTPIRNLFLSKLNKIDCDPWKIIRDNIGIIVKMEEREERNEVVCSNILLRKANM